MKSLKNSSPSIIILIFSIAFMAFIIPQDQETGGPWDIPTKYLKMDNPYSDDASLLKVGKMLYSKHCKSCHGSEGLGDGKKADQLETNPGDFTSDEFKEQIDGKLYYKSFIGRDEMPNFEKKIPDNEDQWAVIMYMKELE